MFYLKYCHFIEAWEGGHKSMSMLNTQWIALEDITTELSYPYNCYTDTDTDTENVYLENGRW